MRPLISARSRFARPPLGLLGEDPPSAVAAATTAVARRKSRRFGQYSSAMAEAFSVPLGGTVPEISMTKSPRRATASNSGDEVWATRYGGSRPAGEVPRGGGKKI